MEAGGAIINLDSGIIEDIAQTPIPVDSVSSSAWYVNFYDGNTDGYGVSSSSNVHCVR